MSLILSLLPFLTGKNEVSLTLSSLDENTIRLVIQPKLAKIEAETEDQAIAIRQSALTRPILIDVPRASADADIIESIEKLGKARTPVQLAHDDHLAQLEEANNAAAAATKAAKEKKEAAEAAKKAGKTPAKPAKAGKPAPAAKAETAKAKATEATQGEEGATAADDSSIAVDDITNDKQGVAENPTPSLF